MDKQLEDILSQCSVSTRMVAKTFFPERFSLPFAENIHGEIFRLDAFTIYSRSSHCGAKNIIHARVDPIHPRRGGSGRFRFDGHEHCAQERTNFE